MSFPIPSIFVLYLVQSLTSEEKKRNKLIYNKNVKERESASCINVP